MAIENTEMGVSEQPENQVSVTVKAFYKGYSVLITRRTETDKVTPLIDTSIKTIDYLSDKGFTPEPVLVYQAPKEIEPPKVEEEKQAENIPVCPIHNKPMMKRSGQYGEFWACPTKENGEWCKYKPKKKK